MTTITSWRKDLRTRREAAARRARLVSELSTYTTPSQIEDLLAAADRQDGPDAEVVREILSHNLQTFHQRVA